MTSKMDICIDHMKRSESLIGLFSASPSTVISSVDINEKDRLGQTLLHHAVRFNNESYLLALLEKGYSIMLKDIYGDAPFDIAVKANNFTFIDLMMKYKYKNQNDSKISDLETKVKSERRKRTYAESQLCTTEIKLKNLEKDLSHEKTKNIAIDKELRCLKSGYTYSKLKQYESENSSYKNELRCTQLKCNRLEDEVDTFKRAKLILEEENSKLKIQIPKLEKELSEVKEERDVYKKRWDKHRRDIYKKK